MEGPAGGPKSADLARSSQDEGNKYSDKHVLTGEHG